MNNVTIDGAVLATWTYNNNLHARLAFWRSDGQAQFCILVFPRDRALEIKEAAFAPRQSNVTPEDPQGIKRGAWIMVTGELRSRDERVTLRDFVKRAKGGTTATPAELEALEGKVGVENRSINEVHVAALTFLGTVNFREDARARAALEDNGGA